MQEKYVVLTGIRRFEEIAAGPFEAIDQLKERIRQRANQRKNPEIGMSLVEALAEGRLNFLVLDEKAQTPLAGELAGKEHAVPPIELLLLFREMLLPELIYRASRAERRLQDN